MGKESVWYAQKHMLSVTGGRLTATVAESALSLEDHNVPATRRHIVLRLRDRYRADWNDIQQGHEGGINPMV